MYQKFRQGDFSLEDERPQRIEVDELYTLLDINSAQTEKKLAEQPGVTASHFRTFTYDGKGSEERQMGSA